MSIEIPTPERSPDSQSAHVANGKSHVPTSNVKSTLFRLHGELNKYFSMADDPSMQYFSTLVPKLDDPQYMSSAILDSLAISGCVAAESPASRLIAPVKFNLTSQSLAYAAKAAEITVATPRELDYACSEVESRFVRALNWHESGQQPTQNHKAAVVLFDKGGEPFAYQKGSGFPIAYTWREASVYTEKGEKWVPGGAIVRPIYDSSEDFDMGPHVDYAGQSLIGLQPSSIHDIAFLRFSAAALPAVLRRPFLQQGAAQISKLAENLDAACRLTSKVVEKRVSALLKRGDILMVAGNK
jgi:hypothetical protein